MTRVRHGRHRFDNALDPKIYRVDSLSESAMPGSNKPRHGAMTRCATKQTWRNLEQFSVDFDSYITISEFPETRQSDSVRFDSNGELARWQMHTRRTSGRGRSRLFEDGESRREAPRVLCLGASKPIRWILRWETKGSVIGIALLWATVARRLRYIANGCLIWSPRSRT